MSEGKDRTVIGTAKGAVKTGAHALPAAPRAILLASMQGHVVRLPLSKQSHIVGRGVDSDVKLDFPEVSRKHCRIDLKTTGTIVTDLGSSGGTFINGEKLEKDGPLVEHDVLGLGALPFTYLLVSEIADDSWPMLVPENGDQPIQLHAPLLTLGRAKADIVIPEIRVSVRHAVFCVQADNSVYVVDAGSTNGTTVNDVPAKELTRLKHDDVIAFAGKRYRLLLSNDSAGRTMIGTLPQPMVAKASAPSEAQSFSTQDLQAALAESRAMGESSELLQTQAITDNVIDDLKQQQAPLAERASGSVKRFVARLKARDREAWKRLGIASVVFGLAVFPFRLTISAECRFAPGVSKKVRPVVAGTVSQVHVKDGESVKAGQLLVTLTDRGLLFERTRASLMLEQAKAGLEILEKGASAESRKIAEERLRGAKTQLAYAHKSLERSKAMAKEGIISREGLQRTEESYSAALQTVREVESELQLVAAKPTPERVAAQRAEVDGAEKALKLAEQRIADLELKAEADGIIGTANTQALQGRVVQPGQELLEVNDYARMWVEILVPESEIADVKPGLRVDARVRSNPLKVHHSEVKEVGLTAEKSATGSLFVVKGLVENQDRGLVAGSSGSAKIFGARQPGIFLVVRRLLRTLRIDWF